jgi:hypothetical protein
MSVVGGPRRSTVFTNTKSYDNFLLDTNIPATSNVGDLSYLDNQSIICASVWFKVLQTSNGSYQFVTNLGGRSQTYLRFQLTYDSGIPGVTLPRSNCSLVINNTQALTGTQNGALTQGWHHFYVEYNNGVGEFFLDDNSVGNTITAQATFTPSPQKYTFFGGSGVLTKYYATQLAIWNRMLTSAEYKNVYNNGCPSDLTSLNPNTWLKMDDAFDNGLGITLPDSGSDNATVESIIPLNEGIETDSPCP